MIALKAVATILIIMFGLGFTGIMFQSLLEKRFSKSMSVTIDILFISPLFCLAIAIFSTIVFMMWNTQ